jgi:hypothetical protein
MTNIVTDSNNTYTTDSEPPVTATPTDEAPRRTPTRSQQGPSAGEAGGQQYPGTSSGEFGTAADRPGTRDMPTDDSSRDGTDMAINASQLTEEQYRGLFSWAKKAVKTVAKKVTDTVKDVAWSDVKNIVKTGLPIAGTAIGGFFGGPAGAAIGGKAGGFAGGLVRGMPETADELQARAIRALDSFEVESAQLDDIVAQVIDRTMPVVIDEMMKDFTERGSRGEGGPADDEVMERFWGKAFGAITEAIADELPWAIKKATQYLSDGGSRDTSTIDPLMVDPETAQRFWGPAFSAVISSIQSTLPALFQQATAGARGKPAGDGRITWQDLEQTRRLAGGDNITVTAQSSIDDPGTVEIALELPPHKSWWKGIQVRGADDSLIGSVDVEGEVKTGSVRVPAGALSASGACLLFTKADGVYKLPSSELPALGGRRVDFYWYAG